MARHRLDDIRTGREKYPDSFLTPLTGGRRCSTENRGHMGAGIYRRLPGRGSTLSIQPSHFVAEQSRNRDGGGRKAIALSQCSFEC